MNHRHVLLSLFIISAMLLAACGGSPASPVGSNSLSASPAGASRSKPQNPQPQVDAGLSKGAAGGDAAAQPEAAASPEGQSVPHAAAVASPAGAPVAGGAAATANDSAQQQPAGATHLHPEPPTEKNRTAAEPYDSTYYQNYGVNPFVDPADDPQSTFAMDIDTASYTVMRRYLNDGYLPDPDSVRVEEYLNAFNYRYPEPDEGSNFAIYTEGGPSPWGGSSYEMVQIGIQGRDIADENRAPTSLTFVIDVSGSMEREDRLETVKQALTMLVEQLREDDRIGIVVYGDYAESVLPPTSGANKRRILDAIYRLAPSGSTNVEAGLDIGFEQADEAFVSGSNMILLCSDGVANNGVTDPQALLEKYQRYTSKGIKLSTFGFGMGNYNDVLMEQLADSGNGFYTYIDSLDEARRVFVDDLTGTLQLIARDAKIQVEFNPSVVSRYRLVGYENRDVADQDFRNDAVDAGEIGAGHSVTALYEIKRRSDAEGPVATVRIRYHRPDNERVVEEQQILDSRDLHTSTRQTTPRWRLAVSVATYAELMRHQRWARGDILDGVLDLADSAAREFEDDAHVVEFMQLMSKAAALAPAD